MEKSSLENKLKKLAALYAGNIRLVALIFPFGLFFLILAECKQSEFLSQYGKIVMTIAIIFWCIATYNLLKYVKAKKNSNKP